MTDPDIVTRLRESDGGYFMRQMFTEAADEIERLRAERDEARREVCRDIACRLEMLQSDIGATEIAVMRGWDCFKESNR